MQNVGEADCNSALGSPDTLDGMPLVGFGRTQGDDRFFVLRGGDPFERSTASLRGQQAVRDVHGSPSSSRATAPVPASPSFSV